MVKKKNNSKTAKRSFGIFFKILLASIPLIASVLSFVYLKDILFWLVFPFATAGVLQSFKISYETFAEYCPYSENLFGLRVSQDY